MIVSPVVAEALGRIAEEVRAEGYAAGVAAADARWRAALAGLLRDEDTLRVGGASPPEHGAPGPSPAAVAGATPPPVPAVPLPSPAVAQVRAGVDARRGVPAPWKTDERAAAMRLRWADATMSVRALHGIVAALPGPPVPPSWNVLYIWAQQMGLGERGRASAQQVAGLIAANVARGVAVPARRAVPGGGAGIKAVDGVGWGEILAWADTVDPDLVLRGSPEARLAQINELRRLEGVPVYRMPPPASAPAAAQVAA